MKEIIQHAVIRVVQPQVVRYTCDTCGKICGTKANPKETWYSTGSGSGVTSRESHYCKRTCSPAGCRRASWSRQSRRHRRTCHYCLGEDVIDALASIGEQHGASQ